MQIFVSHSKNFDFQKELYLPIRSSVLNSKYEFIFPHESSNETNTTKNIIQKSDLLLAEVSYPSTGQGIELGWADSYGVPTVCVYKEERKISNSLSVICNKFIAYKDSQDLITQLGQYLNSFI